MEPIEEENSELAIDIAQAVMAKLDIDRKLDERMKELMLRGDCIFRDMQVRQDQSTDALVRTVGICLEGQRAFQEEHQRLVAAVKELATMVIPYAAMHSQALEATGRAAAIVQEAEVLRKQMDERRLSTAAAAAAVAAASCSLPLRPPGPPYTSPQQSAPLRSSTAVPASLRLGSGTFSITLRKANEVSLGLSVNANKDESKALVVEAVLAGGAVESWNRQCIGDGTGELVVIPGDRIVKVNGIDNDVEKMLLECTKQRLVKLQIVRNTHNASAGSSSPSSTAVALQAVMPEQQAVAPTQQAVEYGTPEKSLQKKKAPEFVHSGIDSSPLKQTQHVAPPPGLFLSKQEDYPAHTMTSDLSAKIDAAAGVSHAMGLAVEMQDTSYGGDAEKEN